MKYVLVALLSLALWIPTIAGTPCPGCPKGFTCECHAVVVTLPADNSGPIYCQIKLSYDGTIEIFLATKTLTVTQVEEIHMWVGRLKDPIAISDPVRWYGKSATIPALVFTN